MKPSEIVRKEYDYRNNRMQKFVVNGKTIKTNYGAIVYPWYDGNGRKYCPVRNEADYEAFDRLVDAGYTYIRFAEMTTRIRGYHELYVMADKRIIK